MITQHSETPLQEIERVVQRKAKDESLDLAASGSNETLSRLVDEEIQAWNSDHLHGLRPYPIDDSGTIAERAMRNLTGYGPLAPLLGREIGDVGVSSLVHVRLVVTVANREG